MNRSANPKQVARLRQLVTSDQEIMGGTTVFKGTRISLDLVTDMPARARAPRRFSRVIPR
jgi:uncharacterized protein (DUF433 family)